MTSIRDTDHDTAHDTAPDAASGERRRFAIARLPQRLLMAAVQGYRLLLKPWLGNVCRFEPSCSAYALQSLQRHGAVRGSALAGWRVLRCHPWCDGGHDPVPGAADAGADTFGPVPSGTAFSTRHVTRWLAGSTDTPFDPRLRNRS